MRKIKLLFCVSLLFSFFTIPVLGNDGEEINIHNKTGHEVLVFLFNDGLVHLNESGGTQIGHLMDGESLVAHVPTNEFSILLVDNNNIWHAEFHDFNTIDITFTANTGNERKSD
jgi:hypothetical protein